MEIRRNNELILTVPRDESSTTGIIAEGIMSVNVATVSFTLSEHVELMIGDSAMIHGKIHFLNLYPEIEKVSTMEYKYICKFESRLYTLRDVLVLGPNATNALVNPNFDFMGTADEYINLLLMNIARYGLTGWRKGNVIETDAQATSFAGDNCLSALAKLADMFKTEFWIENKTLHLNRQGSTVPLRLEYGRDNGLYNIRRSSVHDKQLVTRLYVTGGTRNMPKNYRNNSTTMLLPEEFGHYLDQNVDKYGVKEGSVSFEDVFPHRLGTVTGRGKDIFSFVDNTIEFDVNAHLVPGVTVKLTFNSGQLGGYTFEVPLAGGYNNATKTFTLIPLELSGGVVFPNNFAFPNAGDRYVLTDLYYPPSYTVTTENELLIRAQEFHATVSNPNFNYQVTPDTLKFRRENIYLNIGDSVTIFDVDLGIDRPIRITALVRDAFDPYKYESITLADVVAVPGFAQRANQIKEIQKAITQNRLQDPYRSKVNWKSASELVTMVFDNDNYFTDKIKPLVVETASLLVGTVSGQFLLNGVIFSPNHEGNVARFAWTSGELIHYEIESAPRTWYIDSGTYVALQDPIAYFIYAKCEREGENGTILLTVEKIKTTQDPEYFHFPIGVLHSVVDNVRAISLTYGFTLINGKFIRTGVIMSTDGLTQFDLDRGVISGTIVFGNNGTSTIIDGNLITSSTIILGSGTGVKVGMTGEGEDDASIRIWAGADFGIRDKAPFRVNQAGELVATNADITGRITALSGKIGGLTLFQNNFYNENDEGNIFLKYDHPEGGITGAAIGSNVDRKARGFLHARFARHAGNFMNTQVRPPGEGHNKTIFATASSARWNTAITCTGALELNGPIVYNPTRLEINTTSYTATNEDALLIYSPLSNGVISLPPDPQQGQSIRIRLRNSVGITVRIFGNGHKIRGSDNIGLLDFLTAKSVEEFVFCDPYWYDMT